MKHKLIAIILLITVIVSGCVIQSHAKYNDDFDCLVIYSDQELAAYALSRDLASALMEDVHKAAQTARKLGYAEDSEFIQALKEEYMKAYNIYNGANILLEEGKYSRVGREYPVATVVWKTLREKGFSEQVAAGILGNMMQEVGGNTLNLDYTNKSKTYYGLCQWNRKTYKNVVDADLQEQIDFLLETIKSEIDTYGFCYKSNFNYEQFLTLTDEKEVAKAFAACYERCGSSSYATRQKNATFAYQFFMAVGT